MALGVSGVRINLELFIRGFYKGFESVFDMGAQDLLLDLEEFKGLLALAGINNYDVSEFSILAKSPSKRMGTEAFYKLLGFKKYLCCDLYEHVRTGMRWNAIQHDLNYPITDNSLLGKYDLVTDYGNNEHVFNLTEAYRSLHNLCKVNGIIIIQQQVYGGNGYYNFTPYYFEDMAAANEYQVIFSFYEFNNHFIPIDSSLLDFIDKTVPLGLCYVFRKTDGKDFRIPYQGGLNKKYGTGIHKIQYLAEQHLRTYIPISSENLLQSITWKEAVSILIRKLKSRVRRQFH